MDCQEEFIQNGSGYFLSVSSRTHCTKRITLPRINRDKCEFARKARSSCHFTSVWILQMISPTCPVLSKYHNSLDSGKDLGQNANFRNHRSIVILLSLYSDANLILDTKRRKQLKTSTSGILAVISVAPSCTKSYISWDFTTNINDMTGIISSLSMKKTSNQV